MIRPRVVIDTNVILSGLRSQLGASYLLLEAIPKMLFDFCISPALILEYEDALKKHSGKDIPQTPEEIDDILDYLCTVGEHTKIYYLWRPQLSDPKDDLLLELAVAAGAKQVVTFNLRDFKNAKPFGITPIKPKEFLQSIGV
jgi:putative PIN family toxin of toxin-antitoxin system